MSAVAEKIAEYYRDNLDAYNEKCDLFIEALRETGIIRRACFAAGLDRSMPYVWRANDPEFRKRWDQALEDSTDNVEESLYDMAVSRKNVVATIFYLKNNRHKYRDRVSIDIVSTQREVEDRLSVLANRLPSASTKDLISEALGLPRRNTSKASSKVVEVGVTHSRESSSSE